MPHVVTQACCGDASCVYACPVNCIHPTPDEPDFGIAEMLYIDPATCVDCGACVTACPVGAIVPGHRLTDEQLRFVDVNAAPYGVAAEDAARFPVDPAYRLPLAPIDKPRPLEVQGEMSVAIVGSGPSAMYAADELLRHRQISVTMYERLDRPFGLARFGVAPDHTSTRSVMRLFDDIARHENLRIRLNTEIGRDITLDELRANHHAIIWAGGAPSDRPLPIDGIDARGVHSATSVVGWYNDHPDHAAIDVDLNTSRAVVVGNGNVALDVARILTTDPRELASTSISRAALAALRDSGIEEVVVLGRRGPVHAAFTLPELIGLADHHGKDVDILVDPADLPASDAARSADPTIAAKVDLLTELSQRAPRTGRRRIRLGFWESPAEVVVDDQNRAVGLRLTRNQPTADGSGIEATDGTRVLEAGLILTSIGYRGVAVPGLPFDESRGGIPHESGRILEVPGATDRPVPGMYVTGWIKRGPSGFIGTNKTDSGETVASLLADAEAGLLPTPGRTSARRRFLRRPA